MPNTSMNLLFTILITHINMYEHLYYTFFVLFKKHKGWYCDYEVNHR